MITVIVPIYNVEKYLNRCIESIINQTYRDLEIILVNDGSTDSCIDICNKYKLKDERIKIINKNNGGLSDARNYGIDNANGDYIAFLDSDDWIDETLYEELYKNIEKYNCDICICKYKRVFNKKDEHLNYSNGKKIYSNIESLNEIYRNNSTEMIVAWNKLYKKELFNNMRYPKGRIQEDEYLTPKLLYKAKEVVYLDNELIYYRQTSNSIMNSEFNIKKLDYLWVLNDRLKFFKKLKLDDLYNKTVHTKIETIIKFYFRANESKSDKKSEIIKLLKKELIKLNNYEKKYLSNKDRIRIILFYLTPNFYKKIFRIKI